MQNKIEIFNQMKERYLKERSLHESDTEAIADILSDEGYSWCDNLIKGFCDYLELSEDETLDVLLAVY